MARSVNEYMEKYPADIRGLFEELRGLALASDLGEVEEKLWAGMPSYYHGGSFVRIIPFRDHINIEAMAIAEDRERFAGFDMTPKGMLKLRPEDHIPVDTLSELFRKTLHSHV